MNTEYLLGEFLGSATLTLLGCGVVANVVLNHSKGQASGWIVIATGWFVAVMVAVFVARAAGAPNADVNPAVSFTKYILDYYSFSTLVGVAIAQLAGAFVGATFVWLAYLPHWAATPDASAKLSVFSTQPAIRHYPSNFLCEVIGTFVLVFGIGAIFGHATTHHPASGLGPYLVGILVLGVGLSLGGPTGYAINPARDLGPRLAYTVLPISGKGSADWSYAWVPILGPLCGAFLGALTWSAIF